MDLRGKRLVNRTSYPVGFELRKGYYVLLDPKMVVKPWMDGWVVKVGRNFIRLKVE